MAKIIKLDPTRKKLDEISPEKSVICDHKHVIAYTAFRTVRCTTCGTTLDPFDVLVDMLKGYVPSGADLREEKRLFKEVKKRSRKKDVKDKPTSQE